MYILWLNNNEFATQSNQHQAAITRMNELLASQQRMIELDTEYIVRILLDDMLTMFD